MKVNIIRNLVGNPRNKRILDCGCGNGSVIHPFVNKNHCYGVDIAENLLKEAASKGIEVYSVNLEEDRLPFKDSFFDIVVASHILEHIVDTDYVLSNINRVLKKQGSLVMSFPNVNSLASLATFLLDLPPQYSARYKSPHVRDFTLKTIKWALKINGFRVERAHGTYIYPFKGRVSRYLAKTIPRFADRVILKARKVGTPSCTGKIVLDVREFMECE